MSIAKLYAYNAIGNITSKSDVGTYSYPTPGSARPHGVISVSGGIINTTFNYDNNGNQTGGNGLTVTYTSYNKPATITRGVTTLAFAHGPEHQRISQTGPASTTLYYADPASGAVAEQVIGAGTWQWTSYLTAGGELVGVQVEHSALPVSTLYFHKDHLGSIAVITNAAGAVVERLSYDAWGKRRYPDGTDDPAGLLTSQTPRGFTGHEMLDSVELVHMNGRVYDPLLGRFGSADPVTESPFSSQGWNRYSYVGNSPVNFTDPSGYCFLGCFWNSVFRGVQSLLRKFPIIGSVLRIAASAICVTVAGPLCAPIAATLTSAFVAGVTSGKLSVALKVGLITVTCSPEIPPRDSKIRDRSIYSAVTRVSR